MLIRADARHIPLKDGTVQCCVTSPPFWGLRDYGIVGQIGLERTPEEYVASMIAVFGEVKRVLRDDGVLWLNLGDSYTSGGRRERDPGQSKIHPAFEGDNYIDGLRPDTPVGLKPKDLVGIPWRVAFALQADGWYLRSDIIWAKPNPMPESVRDRPTKSHEYIFLLSKSARYYWDQEAVAEKAGGWNGASFTDSRDKARYQNLGTGPRTETSCRNIRTVWTISTQPYSGAHFATFPQEIPERCIKAGSKPGDIVLDPFVGSGTTVQVARGLGRIGIGLDLTYQQLSAERVGGRLFAEVVNSAW